VMLDRKLMRQRERIPTHVRAQHATMGDCQEVRELPRAAPDVDDACVEGNLFIKQSREKAATRFLQQRADAVHVIVVWKGCFFVELADDVSNIRAVELLVLRWQKQARYALFDFVARPGGGIESASCCDD